MPKQFLRYAANEKTFLHPYSYRMPAGILLVRERESYLPKKVVASRIMSTGRREEKRGERRIYECILSGVVLPPVGSTIRGVYCHTPATTSNYPHPRGLPPAGSTTTSTKRSSGGRRDRLHDGSGARLGTERVRFFRHVARLSRWLAPCPPPKNS